MAAPSPDVIRGALLSGSSWPGPTITFSFPSAGSDWSGYGAGGEPFRDGYAGLNSGQAAIFRNLVASVDRVIAANLVETNDLTAPGDIRIAFSPNTGHAYYPGAGPMSGDIWLDVYKDSSWAAQDNTGTSTPPQQVALHELGHALGLKHPHEGLQTLPAEYGSIRYSMMSYNTAIDNVARTWIADANEPSGYRQHIDIVSAAGPMVDDILALQSLYGADPNTATGSDTYHWAPLKAFFETIYDAGGRDLIDLSDHVRPSIVDLTPGSYSSIGYFTADQQAAYWSAVDPREAEGIARVFGPASDGVNYTYTWTNNLGIAFGTIIEDVRAGAGDDTVTGNAADNQLNGGAGADRLFGADGADQLIGGDGNDYLRGQEGDDLLDGGSGFDDLQGNTGSDTENGGAGADWVVGGQGSDQLAGGDGDDIVYGNLGNDSCSGGQGADWVRGGQGDDVISGDAGDDFMSGDRGSDTVTGGAGADRFNFFVGAGLDRITDFSQQDGDWVSLQGGGAYTVDQQGADTVVTLASGDRLVLVSVELASLKPGWLVAT